MADEWDSLPDGPAPVSAAAAGMPAAAVSDEWDSLPNAPQAAPQARAADEWDTLPDAPAPDAGAWSVGARSAGETAVGMAGKSMKMLARLADKPEETSLFKKGEAVSQYGQSIGPTPAERAAHPIASTVGSIAGGVGPMLAVGAVTGGLGATALGAAEFGLSGAEETYEEAIKKGATPEQASEAAKWSGALNTAAGVIPLHMVLKPIQREVPGLMSWAAAKLTSAAKNGVVFAGIGEAQQYLGEEIAKAYYDPEAGYSPDINRVVGSLIGGGAMGLLTRSPVRPGERPPAAPAGEEAPPPAPPGGPPPAEQAGPPSEVQNLQRQIGEADQRAMDAWQRGDPVERDQWVRLAGTLRDELGRLPAEPATTAPTPTPEDQSILTGERPAAVPPVEDYVDQAMGNLRATSRTAAGTLDTSSTEGKAEKMAADLTPETAAERASTNVENVVRSLYDYRNDIPTTGPEVGQFVNGVAAAVNNGIVKPGQLERTADTKFPMQTAAKDMPVAYDQFSDELAARLADPQADPVETAAWIEWRANLIDHFWSDGAGKTSRALAALPLMRAGLPLPIYPPNKDFVSFAKAQPRVDPRDGGDAYLGNAWDKFNALYHQMVYPKETLQTAINSNAPVEQLTQHPLVQRQMEINRSVVPTGTAEDFANPEWRAARVYDFGTPDRPDQVQGWDAAVERLTDQAKGFSTEAPVENNRHAIIVLGPPAAGKSSISEPLARKYRAAIVDADEAKKVIPEYQNGVGTVAVHEESSELAKRVLANLARQNANVVLPKVGSHPEGIRTLMQDLRNLGYSVDVVHAAATTEISQRRNVQRFLDTGRLVDPNYIAAVGDKPRKTAYILRGEANDFADADTSGSRPEIREGSGPLADVLRNGIDDRSAPVGGPAGSPRGAQGSGLIGQPVQGIPPHRVTAADGTTIDVAPVVVEASSLRTSQDPGYDKSLQPRERNRAASQAQIRDIVSNLDPERLGYSAEADRGAPIVGSDGVVESGNGRIMALRNVYEQGGAKAQAYRDWLTHQGVDVSRYQNPVLVRQNMTPMRPSERRAFTIAANQDATLAMSAPERALADARLLNANILGMIHNAEDLGSAGNRAFVRRFVALLPQAEQGALADSRGALSSEGLARIRNAVLAKAYDDPGIMARIAESTNDEVRSISNALTAAAPEWAKMRAEVAAGRLRPEVDVTPELVEAVKRTAELRARGEKLDHYLSQVDAFDRLPTEIENFMRMFYDPTAEQKAKLATKSKTERREEIGRRAASTQSITDALRFYAQEARKVTADEGLNLGLVPVEPRDIMQLAIDRKWGENGQENLFGDRAGNGPDGEAAGREARGPWISAGGEEPRAPGAGSHSIEAVSARRGENARERFLAAKGLTWEEAASLDTRHGTELEREWRAAGNVEPLVRVERLRPAEVTADPKRFQFRPDMIDKKTGVTAKPMLAGWQQNAPMIVWRDRAGKDFIVDGHHRLNLAKRLEAEGKPVDFQAIVLREADGVTPEAAKAFGQRRNEWRDQTRALREGSPDLASLTQGLHGTEVTNEPLAQRPTVLERLRQLGHGDMFGAAKTAEAGLTGERGAPTLPGKETTNGPPGTEIRGRAPAVPGAEQPKRPVPAKRPEQLSLFGGGDGGPDASRPDVQAPAKPGGAEPPIPGPGDRVTKPPAGGGGTRAPRPRSPAGAGRVEAEQKIAERSRSNYRITPEDRIGAGGPREKVRANIDAIRTIKRIEEEGRDATPGEKAILVKYVGWGAFAQDMFAMGRGKEWQEERSAFRALVSDEEFEAAKGSTLNAHFTSPEVVSGIWDTLNHLGFTGGNALEPAAGIGHFIGLIPDKMAPKTAWSAVELDPLSGKITKALYGGADVNITGFEKFKRPANYYDLAVSNVPFGNYNLREKPYGSFPIHDFFFVKSLDKVRPGGVVAFITSRYTMDRADPTTRRMLARTADLVGAIRLPGGRKGAFAGNAGTEVTTDVLFLRKKVPGEAPFPGAAWEETKPIQTPEGPVHVNEYFADKPNMMLGEMRLIGSMYRADEPVLVGDTAGLQDRILGAARNMPEGAFLPRDTAATTPPISGDEIGGNIKDGAFFLKDGKLFQRRQGQGFAHDLNATDTDKVTRLVGIRDNLNDLLRAQLGGEGDKDAMRAELRRAYDDFVKEHGPINKEVRTVTSRLNKEGEPVVLVRRPNFSLFDADPDAYKVAAIENYDPETDKATRATVQTKDVIAPRMERQINGPSDALAASLDSTGGIDLDHIAQSLNLDTHDDVIRALGDLIYQNPDGRKWETTDAYLSGNVVQKLEDAKAIAQEDPSYLRNVSALEKVQPEPLSGVDITAQFGAPWVPEDVYSDFLKSLGGRDVGVTRVPVTGDYRVEMTSYDRDAQSKYGVNPSPQETEPKLRHHHTVKFSDIAEAALNNRQITIRDRQPDDSYVVNHNATSDARIKTDLLKEAFTGDMDQGLDGWAFADPERAARLEGIFNRTHNNLAQRKFDGSHLTLPGLNPDFATRQHRKDAVWRIIQSGNTLLAHAVGGGKTSTMVAGAMEEKRLGLINKPLFAVPNHMLEQFSREFIQAYPDAKILVAQKDEMTRENRKAFLAKASANDWDGIVMTHSAFGRINMGVEWRRRFVQEQIDQLEQIMRAEAAESGKNSLTVKNLERAKKKLAGRLDALMNEERKDEGTSFEESGVDRLYVDEAHCFPYDTLIATDRGALKIGDIVNRRLPVKVASYDHKSGRVIWRAVHNYWRYGRGGKQFVVVKAENAEVCCTANHQVFIEGRGYVRAEGVRSNESLRALRDGISVPQFGKAEQRQAPLLRKLMRVEMAYGTTRALGEVDWPDVGRNAQEMARGHRLCSPQSAGILGTNGRSQSNVDAWDQGEGFRVAGRSHIPSARRQWAANQTAVTSARLNWASHGVFDWDKSGAGPVSEPANKLQGRSRRPSAEAGDRSGRPQSPLAQMEISRPQEDRDTECTRVVSVEVLERGSDCEPRDDRPADQFVYDLGIEGEHNYFANGILVHNSFKNLAFTTRMGNVKGLAQGDAQRAEDLFLKIKYLEQNRPGRSAVFATGTPVSNTMAELWTMQRYLQNDKLKERGLETFDAWANTFGRVVNNMELSADGRTFKEVSSFSKFVNVPELVSLYAEIADTKTADMLNLPRPEVKTRSGAPGIEIVEAEPSEQEEQHIQSLVELAESLKGKRPEKGQPNMLSVVTAGRKVATDGRLIGPDFEFNPQGKIAKAIDNITRIYKEGNKDPAAPNKVQMVFLDMGVPQSRGGAKPKPAEDGGDPATVSHRFDLYADLKKRLVAQGIPAREIAAIHDAATDDQKAKLFARVRNGDVRVILGSSEKMGVGTNVQDRLIAMHHLDAPWKPAEVEQRDGRIVRQGNQNPAVQIYRYVTKRSFDAFMWQKLDTKSKFIGQVLSGAKGSRHAEDIDNPLPEAAEMKAAASGDPRIIEHAELDRQVRSLTAQRRAYEQTKSRAGWEQKAAKDRIAQFEQALPPTTQDAAAVQDIAGDKFQAELGGTAVTTRKDAGQAILDRLNGLDPRGFYTPKVVNVGKLSGFDMNIEVRSAWDGTDTTLRALTSLKGPSGYGYSSTSDTVINSHTDPGGLIRRFENILGGVKERPGSLGRMLDGERDNLSKLEKTATADWPKEKEYRATLAKMADLTKAMKAPEHPDVVSEEAKAQRPQDQTETPAFLRWFGDSKVADAEGKPKVVYHGTTKGFGTFDASRLGDSTGHPSSKLGFFFSETPEAADLFTHALDDTVYPPKIVPRTGANLMPVYLSIKNPFKLTVEQFREINARPYGKEFEAEQPEAAARTRDWIAKNKASLLAKGYDGIHIEGDPKYADHLGGEEYAADAWVAFKPEQIKSATGNRGTFDPANPDIRARAPGPAEHLFDDHGPRAGEQARTLATATEAHVRLSGKYTANEKKLVAAAEEIGARMAPLAKVQGAAALRQHGNPIWGAFINSPAFPHLIAWSLERGHPGGVANTVRHEIIHHLREAGLIRPNEWQALENAASTGGWIKKYGIDTRYPDNTKEANLEEAIAEHFGQWRTERSVLNEIKDPVQRLVRNAYNRVELLMRRLAAAARKFLGADATANDVFTRIETGEVGRRTPNEWKVERTRALGDDRSVFTVKGPNGEVEHMALPSNMGKRDILAASHAYAENQDTVRAQSPGAPVAPQQPQKQRRFARGIGMAPRPSLAARATSGKTARQFKNFWTSTFQPELVSDRAFEADPLFARYKSAQAQEKDSIIHEAEKEWEYWNKRGDADRLRQLHDIETHATPADPEQARMAKLWAKRLDDNWLEEKRAGSTAGYVSGYIAHIWEKPEDWNKLAARKTAQVGPTWFQKQRTYDYIQDGINAGLKLRYTNPVDIITHRLLSGVDMRMRMDLLQKLKDMGLAWEGKQGGEQLVRRGWQSIDAPDRKEWVLAPDVQYLWKNAVEAKGLWEADHLGGSVFRGWMALKNAWVPMKLALSAFHPLHVLHINYSNGMALAFDELAKGHNLAGALKALGEGFTGPIAAAIPGMPHRGKAARAGWAKRPSAQTPEQRADNALMNDGGFVPQLSEQLKIGAKRQMQVAWERVKRGEGGATEARQLASGLMRRPLEVMQGPIFEKWIPSLKTAAYLNQASALLRRRPELMSDDAARRVALRAIAKSIDNRFGEMFYGNTFWNRTLKDSAIGSFLSLGWNLGFVREFGGAGMEAVSRPAGILPTFRASMGRAAAREATNKIAFAMSYVGSAALINGMMTYLYTGQQPQGLDYIFAKIGGENPDGTPRRVTNMFYLREVPMLLKHIQERGGNVLSGAGEMLWNKLMFEPFHELMNNRDYYGYNIWDENAPVYKQVAQAVSHVFSDQLSPMSVAGAGHAAELSGKPFPSVAEAVQDPSKIGQSLAAKGVIESVLGFGPAPAYVEKSGIQNRIAYLYQQHVAPASKPEEQGENTRPKMAVRAAILIAKRDGDDKARADAFESGRKIGMTAKAMNDVGKTPTDLYLFSRLPEADQKALLKQASPEEYKRYYPKANLKVRAEISRAREEEGRARGGRVGNLIDHTHDVITGANSSKRLGGPVYVDRRIPQFSPRVKGHDGKPADLWKYLAIHERDEAKAMARGASYSHAHSDVATPAERAAVEADGVSWAEYTHEIDGYLAKIEHETVENPPARGALHVDPDKAIGHHRSSNKRTPAHRADGGAVDDWLENGNTTKALSRAHA